MVDRNQVRRPKDSSSAFTLIELLVVIAIIALLIGILLPALGEARKTGKITICHSNLKQFGTATNSYATDFQDKIWSFTVTPATADRLQYADLIAQARGGSDLAAASAQAVDILRRRADREDIQPITGWIPHVLYNHLVCQDYLAARLPEKMVICPEDRNRLLWSSDPRAFDAGAFSPSPAGGEGSQRWPYSSSYECVPASYANDSIVQGGTVTQAALYYQYQLLGPQQNELGKRKLTQVLYPAQKVHMMDSVSRHSGKAQVWYAYPEARQPLLFFDAHVSIERTGVQTPFGQPPIDANEGFNPGAPRSLFPLSYTYDNTSRPWDPQHRPNLTTVIGFYRWCRGGLQGIDFRGYEINTSNW